MESIEDDWESFLQNDYGNDTDDDVQINNRNFENNGKNQHSTDVTNIPKCSDLYISTKTKISYLNKRDIDIKRIFWDIPILDYTTPKNGIIKKQIKYSSTCKEETESIEQRLVNIKCYEEQIIEHIDNPEGRIKFKHQRKISIGTCKKDILSYRSKKKRAFFNCFVLIMRLYDDVDETFKEMHVKVFNTGKLEIPGIQSDVFLEKVLHLLVTTLQPFLGNDLTHLSEKSETVLINSNFNCGYYIDRDKLYDLLKYKYRINSNFDACSYPGIQSKFYYDNTLPETDGLQQTGLQTGLQTGQQPNHIDFETVSFMIFRTGSVLIVGKCEENVLFKIYDFIKHVLEAEYEDVHSINIDETPNTSKSRKTKIRKKTLLFDCA
jgi:hypothetical protein